jgi:hypothetical protein
MKYILLVLPLLLSGCFTTVPVKQKFPNAPAILLERCPQLMELPEDQNNIKNFMGIVIQNYGTYYQCAEKVQGWQEWYKENQKIMNGK